MDRGAWLATVLGVAKSWKQPSTKQQKRVRLKQKETMESGFSCKRGHKTYAQDGCEK